MSPALAGRFLTTVPPGESPCFYFDDCNLEEYKAYVLTRCQNNNLLDRETIYKQTIYQETLTNNPQQSAQEVNLPYLQ